MLSSMLGAVKNKFEVFHLMKKIRDIPNNLKTKWNEKCLINQEQEEFREGSCSYGGGWER